MSLGCKGKACVHRVEEPKKIDLQLSYHAGIYIVFIRFSSGICINIPHWQCPVSKALYPMSIPDGTALPQRGTADLINSTTDLTPHTGNLTEQPPKHNSKKPNESTCGPQAEHRSSPRLRA